MYSYMCVCEGCSISDTSYLVCSISSPFYSHLLLTCTYTYEDADIDTDCFFYIYSSTFLSSFFIVAIKHYVRQKISHVYVLYHVFCSKDKIKLFMMPMLIHQHTSSNFNLSSSYNQKEMNINEIVSISWEEYVCVELPICIIVPQLRFLAECPKFPNHHNCVKLL